MTKVRTPPAPADSRKSSMPSDSSSGQGGGPWTVACACCARRGPALPRPASTARTRSHPVCNVTRSPSSRPFRSTWVASRRQRFGESSSTGNGWYGTAPGGRIEPERLESAVAAIRGHRDRYERDPDDIDIAPAGGRAGARDRLLMNCNSYLQRTCEPGSPDSAEMWGGEPPRTWLHVSKHSPRPSRLSSRQLPDGAPEPICTRGGLQWKH